MKIYRRDGSLIKDEQMKSLIWYYIYFDWVNDRHPEMSGTVAETICDLLLAGI